MWNPPWLNAGHRLRQRIRSIITISACHSHHEEPDLSISLCSPGLLDDLQIIDQIDHANPRMTLRVRLPEAAAACPDCRIESRRIHGHYWRYLHDLPCFGNCSTQLKHGSTA